MVSEKVSRTKASILAAAKELFEERDFNSIGIREIAKRAGCSHTAIYLYFKNKSSILAEVAREPLENLYQELEAIETDKLPASDKLIQGAHTFVKFGFEHANSFSVLFLEDGERVDLEDFTNPVSELRMKSFNLLKSTVVSLLPTDMSNEETLNIVRGVYLFLVGMVHNYAGNGNSYDDRLHQIVTDYLTFSLLGKG